MVDDAGLEERLRFLERGGAGHTPLREPQITPGSWQWAKQQKDEVARQARIAAAAAADERARREREQAEKAAAQRRVANAPKLTALRTQIQALEAKRSKLMSPLDRQIDQLRAEAQELM